MIRRSLALALLKDPVKNGDHLNFKNINFFSFSHEFFSLYTPDLPSLTS